MKRNIRFFGCAFAFLLLFGCLFAPLQELVCRKSLTGTWDMTNKIGGFYNEPENEFEILFFGSSHTYAAFSPLRLWERTGMKSYVFATQRQPLWATHAYMVEAFKTQSPRLAVVDCRGLLEEPESYYDEGITYSYMDDLPFSWNKVKLAWVSAKTMEGRVELLCNFIKYHGRWTDLTDADYAFDRSALHDPYKGYVFLPKKDGAFPRPSVEGVTECAQLEEKNEVWLRRVIELCQREEVPLWLVKTPSNLNPEEKRIMNRAAAIAGEYGVPFTDFNEQYSEIGLTGELFFDERHMDARGAALFTDYFAGALLERYSGFRTDGGNPDWAAAAEAYEAELEKLS